MQYEVLTPSAGATPVTIRFIADNPGPWFLHCHIGEHLNFRLCAKVDPVPDMHLEAGLAAVFVEAPSDIISGDDAVVPNSAWEGLCDAYYALDSAFQ
jgi:iron transport multicopper oxidase